MKYAIIAATLLPLAVTPAFAGGRGGTGLLGSVLAPVTTTVSALNVSVLNGASVLSGNAILSGNVVGVLSGNKTVVSTPVGISGILNGGLLGGGAHGCGCN